MLKWNALLVVCVALPTLVVAGCGGDDDGMDGPDAAVPDAQGPPPDVQEFPPDGPLPDGPDATPPDPPDAGPDAMLGPETCDNDVDDNTDGLVDCDDPLCADSFFPCQAPACADGEQRVFFHATDLPKLIHGGQTTSSTITVPPGGAVTNASAKVSIGHNYVRDLVIKLTNPEGTIAELSSNNGSVGHNYLNTVFSDAAATSVIHGIAPFTGVFKPEQPFTRFAKQQAGGAWKMDVVETFDDNPGDTLDTGGFASYDLMLCVCTNCEVGPNCSDTLDNDGDGNADCADTDCAGNLRCIPETACADGLDNDLDGLADCRDSQCNGHNNCQFGTEVACGDAFDNDGDGQSDCFDVDCRITPLCREETNCRDGIDNDSDTFRDCADPGCKATEAACQATETTCDDSFDNDGDNLADCMDPNCVNTVICAVPACPAGQQTLTIAATDLPLPIPDSNPAGVTSTINVATTGTVNRVIVTVSATHTFDGDVVFSLIGPTSTPPGVALSTNNGSAGDNFDNTVFADTAGTAITAGTAPYAGPFRPQSPLSVLNGTPLAGAWKLFAKDTASTDVGTVTKFELFICYTP